LRNGLSNVCKIIEESPELEASMNDRELMLIALEEAKLCKPEDHRPKPMVGAVLALNGEVMARAHRNEDGHGSHAEYLALMKLMAEGPIPEGLAVYTTLEPCVKRRSREKIPCARRLIDAKVARVLYGIIDPHKTVQSKGILQLRANQVPVESFPADIALEIEKLNADFIRTFTRGEASDGFVQQAKGRSLDEWYQTVNTIYFDQNLGRTAADIFSHLVETVGGMSLISTKKSKPAVDPQRYAIKSLAWWMALCGKLRVRSVEDMLWAKFPGVCPYCQACPHNDECKLSGDHPDWVRLRQLGVSSEKPLSLGAWQRMFGEIYPGTITTDASNIYVHIIEELGELAEAVRVFEYMPGLFLDEAPDVFAWIMQMHNSFDNGSSSPGARLEEIFCREYPDLCQVCASEVCECPSVLPSSVGRLASAIPPVTSPSGNVTEGPFLSVTEALEMFEF
jgi:pyrimidine deaminase RibD-like protein